jgi:putative addiction module component (TIGR02574 family)
MSTLSGLSENASKLLPDLLALPASDRLTLAQCLYDTVEEGDDLSEQDLRQEWKTELARRLEEIKSGAIVAEPIEEMFRRSRERHP